MDNEIKAIPRYTLSAAKWFVISVIEGVIVGFVGTTFVLCLSAVNKFRARHPQIIWLLPVAGVIIALLYHFSKNDKNTGTNLVIESIHSDAELSVTIAPLIYVSTLMTHLFGGSAGREGAALEIGGSLGNAMGRLIHLDDDDTRTMIMAGMSAAFSSVFGTPLAATFFSMELITVGIMHYSALVPCAVAALSARRVAVAFGVPAETFEIAVIPEYTIKSTVIIAILAALCAMLSILFCETSHGIGRLYGRYIENKYVRVAVGGAIIIAMTLIVGDQTYNGSGANIIEACFEGGDVTPWAFIVKLLFTAVCIGAGFKGGEIVPAFTVGASFGFLFGTILGFNPRMCAAVGMLSVFCGITNCPVTSLLLAFEMFGYEGMPFWLVSVAVSYTLSGYFGLYHTQKIVYSKYKTNYTSRYSE